MQGKEKNELSGRLRVVEEWRDREK